MPVGRLRGGRHWRCAYAKQLRVELEYMRMHPGRGGWGTERGSWLPPALTAVCAGGRFAGGPTGIFGALCTANAALSCAAQGAGMWGRDARNALTSADCASLGVGICASLGDANCASLGDANCVLPAGRVNPENGGKLPIPVAGIMPVLVMSVPPVPSAPIWLLENAGLAESFKH